MNTHFALYSEISARLYGTFWWKRADGEMVEATALIRKENLLWVADDYRWEDLQFRGGVKEFVREGRKGEMEGQMEEFLALFNIARGT